jgi:hypothetical protein
MQNYVLKPSVKTSKHTSHTLTGFVRLNLRIGKSLIEHLEHKILPQCRQ